MDKETDKRLVLMSEAPPLKAIFVMSVPVILGMMVNVIYNLVDTFYIGKMGDELQLAASNLSTPIFVIVMAVASLIGTGGASYLSRALGAGKKKKAENTLSAAAILILIFGAIIAIIGSIFIDKIPYLLGASEQSYIYTKQYSWTLLLGSVFIIANFALGQLIRAEGSTMLSMIGMLIGTVANIILDPLFIFTFGWGITGAAVATVLGNALSALFFLICFLGKKTLLHLSFTGFEFEKQIYKEIFSIGIPATLGQMLISVSQMVCNNLAGEYGDTAVASLGIALKIMTVGTYVFMGFNAGCQPLMGYNYGAKNYTRVKQFIRTGVLATTIVGASLAVILGGLAPLIVDLFTPLPEVRLQGTAILRTLALSLPFMGGVTLCSTTFQAMGKPIKSLIITISRQGILYIPLLFILNSVMGFSGMLFSQPLTDALMLFVSVIIMNRVIKKSRLSDIDSPLNT